MTDKVNEVLRIVRDAGKGTQDKCKELSQLVPAYRGLGKRSLSVPQDLGNVQAVLEYVIVDEIAIIKSRIEPQDCGHMHTTVNMLQSRVEELRGEIENDTKSTLR